MDSLNPPDESFENQLEIQTEEHIVELPIGDYMPLDQNDIDSWGKNEVQAMASVNSAVGSGATAAGFVPRRTSILPDVLVNTYSYHVDSGNNPALNSTGNMTTLWDYVARSFTAHEDYNVNKVAFRLGSTGSPVGYTVTGGISAWNSTDGLPTIAVGTSAITFLGSGTKDTFSTNSYLTITLGSTVALTKGTKYCVAFQTTSVTSGSINYTRNLDNSYFTGGIYHPLMVQRVAGSTADQVGPLTGAQLWGYDDGMTTQWYGTPVGAADNTTYTVNRTTANTPKAVGARIRLDWNIQEIFLRGVSLARCRIATDNTITLQVLAADGITQLTNASASITYAQQGSEVAYRTRHFLFPQPVRLLPYTDYFVMLSGTGTSASSNTTASGLQFITIAPATDQSLPFAYDTINIGASTNTIGVKPTETPSRRVPMNLIIDDAYLGNRVGGNN